jgi:plasmid maintenance system antidote protein VapI
MYNEFTQEGGESMVAINVKKIQYEMAKEELTYTELANRSGIHKTTISEIISRGSCTPAYVGKLAKALELDPLEIMA